MLSGSLGLVLFGRQNGNPKIRLSVALDSHFKANADFILHGPQNIAGHIIARLFEACPVFSRSPCVYPAAQCRRCYSYGIAHHPFHFFIRYATAPYQFSFFCLPRIRHRLRIKARRFALAFACSISPSCSAISSGLAWVRHSAVIFLPGNVRAFFQSVYHANIEG